MLQAAYRRHAVACHIRKESAAVIILQAVARQRQAKRWRLELIARIVPMTLRIQARARGASTRRQLREAHAAARRIQAAWRSARSRVVGRRLAGATARLQAGLFLSKYQKGGLSHERHERFVWLSKDKTKLCWTRPTEHGSRCSETDKSVSMEAVTAISTGCKTELMKKMERRAGGAGAGGANEMLRKVSQLFGARSRGLDADCALSLIGSDRVLDLVAPDEATRTLLLRDLRTLLLYGHHLEHKAALGAVEAGVRRGSLVEPAAAAAA